MRAVAADAHERHRACLVIDGQTERVAEPAQRLLQIMIANADVVYPAAIEQRYIAHRMGGMLLAYVSHSASILTRCLFGESRCMTGAPFDDVDPKREDTLGAQPQPRRAFLKRDAVRREPGLLHRAGRRIAIVGGGSARGSIQTR